MIGCSHGGLPSRLLDHIISYLSFVPTSVSLVRNWARGRRFMPKVLQLLLTPSMTEILPNKRSQSSSMHTLQKVGVTTFRIRQSSFVGRYVVLFVAENLTKAMSVTTRFAQTGSRRKNTIVTGRAVKPAKYQRYSMKGSQKRTHVDHHTPKLQHCTTEVHCLVRSCRDHHNSGQIGARALHF